MKEITDFTDSSLWIAWDGYRALPQETKRKIELYGWDHKHEKDGIRFNISSERLSELEVPKLLFKTGTEK